MTIFKSSQSPESGPSWTWLLRVGAAACFLGWAWQALYWAGPYRAVLWDPRVFNLLQSLGWDWDSIVGGGDGSSLILLVSHGIGWIFLAGGVVAVILRRGSLWQLMVISLGGLCLALTAWCKFILSRGQHAMLTEHGGQVLMPLVLVLALYLGSHHRLTRWVALVAVATTFLGHGAYAIGWAPTPGHFIGMIRVILPVSGETALTILRAAGWIDILVCVGIFIPMTRGPALVYAAIWGFLTAVARPVAGMGAGLIYWGADQYVHEALLRMPHAIIPLFLFLIYRARPVDNPQEQVAHDASLPADRQQPSPVTL